jgi:hypothetical protein
MAGITDLLAILEQPIIPNFILSNVLKIRYYSSYMWSDKIFNFQ